MRISIRNERGQAIVEYILVLVVVVVIALGGLYQLNDAFRQWAVNYFGTYIACLLETGELPTLSGSDGDGGICNQFFQPYSLANGRPLIKGIGAGGGDEKKQHSNSTHEGRTAGGGGGGGSSNTEFSRSRLSGAADQNAKNGAGKKADAAYTGDTRTSSYGAYSGFRQNSSRMTRVLLDQSFAFQNERERQTRRQISSPPTRNYTGSAGAKTAVHFRNKVAETVDDAPSSGFTVANFLRYIIIAAIILAMVIFLGGQGLQIGKGMD